jgi:hypothetical protein
MVVRQCDTIGTGWDTLKNQDCYSALSAGYYIAPIMPKTSERVGIKKKYLPYCLRGGIIGNS